MASPRLTDIAIGNLKPRATRYEVADPGAHGLYVVVHPSSKKSFVVRYRHAGLPRKLTLQGGISLAVARKLCADAMHEVAQGHDPAEAKLSAKAKALAAAADSVQAVCENYIRREGGKLRSVHVRERTLARLVFPALGDRPIEEIRRSDLVKLLDKIEDKNGSRQADLVLAYLRRVFSWHASRSDTFSSPIIRTMGRYNAKEHERARVLDDDELRAVWKASAPAPDPENRQPFHGLLRFLLLTGCRRDEARRLTRAEINDGNWLLPAARNKVKVDLLRPLSKAAQAVLDAQPRIDGGGFVFSIDGRRPLELSRQKKNFDAACGVTGWRLHDVRRTSRTLMSRAGINADVAERCLGHVIGGVRGVYDRHQFTAEMAHAFEALAAQIERIINPPEGDVVPLIRQRVRSAP
jgi:integrase